MNGMKGIRRAGLSAPSLLTTPPQLPRAFGLRLRRQRGERLRDVSDRAGIGHPGEVDADQGAVDRRAAPKRSPFLRA